MSVRAHRRAASLAGGAARQALARRSRQRGTARRNDARIQRALELHAITGRSLSSLQERAVARPRTTVARISADRVGLHDARRPSTPCCGRALSTKCARCVTTRAHRRRASMRCDRLPAGCGF
jgi:tRNA A37 N6-isopentenylltransferase MiaA